jgi:hypothetical protein
MPLKHDAIHSQQHLQRRVAAIHKAIPAAGSAVSTDGSIHTAAPAAAAAADTSTLNIIYAAAAAAGGSGGGVFFMQHLLQHLRTNIWVQQLRRRLPALLPWAEGLLLC